MPTPERHLHSVPIPDDEKATAGAAGHACARVRAGALGKLSGSSDQFQAVSEMVFALCGPATPHHVLLFVAGVGEVWFSRSDLLTVDDA